MEKPTRSLERAWLELGRKTPETSDHEKEHGCGRGDGDVVENVGGVEGDAHGD